MISVNMFNRNLLEKDLETFENDLSDIVSKSRFLVLGGAGTIGQAVVKEIFKRNPRCLHVVDISENNLVELVRDIRSTYGYIDGEFKTFALDISSHIFDSYIHAQSNFDYVLNLSALKHVRSEKDPFTLMRLIDVNIINTLNSIALSKEKNTQKYFCVSTDKAANPVNMMGASKRIMELFLMRESSHINISTARFANVAYSDGSLLQGFEYRLKKHQPIVAPSDVQRYFVSKEESGQICLFSTLLGENRDIFFPKLETHNRLHKFDDLARDFLISHGYEPVECNSEEEARSLSTSLPAQKKWPCFFSPSNTTGEKDIEEFYMGNEKLDLDRFGSLGVIQADLEFDTLKLDNFLDSVQTLKKTQWTKEALVTLFQELLPEFDYLDKGTYLDSKM